MLTIPDKDCRYKLYVIAFLFIIDKNSMAVFYVVLFIWLPIVECFVQLSLPYLFFH
jgi:hypothetical protein